MHLRISNALVLLGGCAVLGCGADRSPSGDTPFPDAALPADAGLSTEDTGDPGDLDGDGYAEVDGDCDDGNPAVFPGAVEIPDDGIDQDCDGEDGVGDSALDQDNDGFTPGAGDCDDKNFEVKPTGVEVCGDGVDQNCDGSDLPCDSIDADADNYTTIDGDCDDDDKEVNPGQTEVPYNGKDDDCRVDTPDDDLDGDGVNQDKDCDDNDAARSPKHKEIPGDGIDNDCNEKTPDDDHDGDGVPAAQDCDDQDKSVHPGAKEICYNSKDDDCDVSSVDDDCDGDGFVLANDCDDKNNKRNPAQQEIPYNNIDEDCDGRDTFTSGWSVQRNQPQIGGPALASNGSSFLVAWTERATASAATTLRAQLLKIDGSSAGAAITIDSGSVVGPPAIASNGNRYLLVYRFRGAAKDQLRVRLIKPDGTPIGAPVKSYALGGTINAVLDVSYASGTYGIAWRERATGAANSALRWAGLDGAGAVIWSKKRIESTSSYTAVSLASDGAKFLLAHSSQDKATKAYSLDVRAVVPSSGATQKSATLAQGVKDNPRPWLSFGQGGYLVTWYQASGGSGSLNVFGQRLNLNGVTVGSPITISTAVGDQSNPRPVFCNGKHNVLFGNRHTPVQSLYTQSVSASGSLIDTGVNVNRLLYAGDDAIGWFRAACAGTRMHITAMIRPTAGHRLLRSNFVP